jgi:hypothetical protein
LDAREFLILAIYEITTPARLAVPATAAKEPYPDPLANGPTLYAIPEGVHDPHHFVAGNPWPVDRENPLDRRRVGMTDSAGFHANSDLTGRRRHEWFLR